MDAYEQNNNEGSEQFQGILETRRPQLENTPFSGDVLKSKEFWDAFEASIDKVKYAPINKFNYLKSKLKGKALEPISGYQLSK